MNLYYWEQDIIINIYLDSDYNEYQNNYQYNITTYDYLKARYFPPWELFPLTFNFFRMLHREITNLKEIPQSTSLRTFFSFMKE